MKKKNYLVCFDIEKQENLQLLRASDMHFKTKKHAGKITMKILWLLGVSEVADKFHFGIVLDKKYTFTVGEKVINFVMKSYELE